MYLDYYGFTEKPFAVTPNPRFIFFSSIHKEAFALLLYGINSRFGFMELVGEVGTGKTTVLRTLLNQLDEETCRTALILNPPLSAVDLMRAVNQEFGIPAETDNIAGLIGELNRYLLRENAAGRTVVLIVDEAQTLAPEVLEQIRLISNLETATDKLIQIVLAGQPELARLLERPDLRQLNQRIALRYSLTPLGRDETRSYIDHRLDTAGAGRKASFTPWAIRLIHRYSRGTPRLINMLCDRALLIGYTENSRKLTGRITTLAWRDITLKSSRISSSLIMGGVAMAAALLFVLLTGRHNPNNPPLRHQAVTPAVAGERGSLANVTSAASRAEMAALRKGVLAELSVRSEEKSAVQAFNAVTSQWHTPPVTQLDPHQAVIGELQREAGRRNLMMTAYSGSLDDIVRFGLPALLPLTSPAGGGAYLIGMTGTRGEQLQISPPLVGRTSFSRSEFISLRPNKAYLIWRNVDRIPPVMARGARGERVRKLQALLRKAGTQKLEQDGIFETATVRAIRTFQASRRIPVTGALDPLTLVLLYQAANYPGRQDGVTSRGRT
jgi:general secretion pathway protein A